MTKKLGIGVIGLGRLGSSYAKYFTGRIAGAALVAISDVNETAIATWPRSWAFPKLTTAIKI